MPAAVLPQAADIDEQTLVDWGPVAEPLGEPVSLTRGVLLHRDDDGANEVGLWVCTPGRWRCVIERAEFCHFLAGRAVYARLYVEDPPRRTAGVMMSFPIALILLIGGAIGALLE